MDTRAREIEETYRGWVTRLKQATATGTGAEVEEAARMVIGLAAIINPYHPRVWREGEDDRDIVEIFEQALSRITADIRENKIAEGDTLEHYHLYKQNIQMRYDDVRYRLLVQWAADRKLYAEMPEVTA